MLDAARKFFLDLILENEEVKKFPKDFISASMQWIRSWFLIDNDPVAKEVLDSPGDNAKTTSIVEQKLTKLLENERFKKELKEHIAEYTIHKLSIKNFIGETDIEVQGNAHIGDRGGPIDDVYDQKNIVKASTIKAGGDFHLGDDVL